MKNNFDLKKFLVENKLTSNSKVLKEEVDYSIELLVPTVYYNVESGELGDTPYAIATEDEIESGEADITSYTDGEELDEFVFSRDYEQAKYFEKAFPDLFKVVGHDDQKMKEDQQRDHQFYANQEGAKVIMQIAKDAINLMDEQPGTPAYLALQTALEEYIEENDLD
jgi:hypothetical protein